MQTYLFLSLMILFIVVILVTFFIIYNRGSGGGSGSGSGGGGSGSGSGGGGGGGGQPCTPNCFNKNCGDDDGCKGLCSGKCPDNYVCNFGKCISGCNEDYPCTKDFKCVSNKCVPCNCVCQGTCTKCTNLTVSLDQGVFLPYTIGTSVTAKDLIIFASNDKCLTESLTLKTQGGVSVVYYWSTDDPYYQPPPNPQSFAGGVSSTYTVNALIDSSHKFVIDNGETDERIPLTVTIVST